MHRVKWTIEYGQKRNIVGKIVDCGDVIHLHPTGTFNQTYEIIIEIEDYPRRS